MEDDDGMGGFFLKLIGLIILGGIAAMLIFLFIDAAFYRWGGIVTIIVVFAVLGVISWTFDRRAQKRYGAEA